MKFNHFAVVFILFRDVVPYVTNTDINVTNTAETPTTYYTNCSFELNNGETEQIIQSHIKDEKELIFLHFNIPNLESDIFGINGTIYNILDIVITKGERGKELLLLEPQFEQYSLGLLMLGVEHVHIDLKPLPKFCLSTMTEQQFSNQLFEFVSSKFKLLENNDQTYTRLCNMHIRKQKGTMLYEYAEFYYQCCYRNDTEHFSCSEIEPNFWKDILNAMMDAINTILFFFGPLIIQASWYTENEYNSTLRLPKKHKIKFEKLNDSGKNILNRKEYDQIFKKYIDTNILNISISSVQLDTYKIKTVSSSRVPVAVLYFLYRRLICQFKKPDFVKECCKAKCCVCPCGAWLEWDKCLKLFMQIVFTILLLVPWFVRIAFFYSYEDQDQINKTTFAEKRNLNKSKASLNPSDPVWISGLVIAFIMSIIILPCKRLFYSAEIQKSHKIHTLELIKISEICVEKILVPCKKFGVMGIFSAPVSLLMVHSMYAVKFIPLLQMCFSIAVLLCIVWEHYKFGKLQKICLLGFFVPVIISCILTVFMAFTELFFFYITILIYVGIGIILNVSSVLTYVTFTALLIFYAYDSVRNVKKRFEIFRRVLIGFFVSNIMQGIESENIPNCAVQFICERAEESREKRFCFKVEDKKLYLSSDPFLFFDEDGKPFITERLFFKICEIKSIGAPGSLWENYKISFLNFSIIFLFMFVVIVVVLAFGQTRGVPDTYQALAALGGGLIPFVFRGYYSRSNDGLDIKTDNFFFRNELNKILEEYSEELHITDVNGEEDQSEPYDSHIMVHTDESTGIPLVIV